MMTFPKHLLEGYKAFATQRCDRAEPLSRAVGEGQFPEVMVIAAATAASRPR